MRELIETDYLRSLGVDEIIEWVEAATRHRTDFLYHWGKRERLRALLDESLRGSRHTLDRFEGGLACFPRGVVVHWMAGNVPILGELSVLQALLTKNGSIIKLSGEIDLDPISTKSVDGERLLESVHALYLDRDDPRQHELSMAADLRIAWGGKEAVEAIRRLPCQSHCEDLIFGPRTSFAVVDHLHATERTADLVAFDLCQLDQRGCNSPHTLFVEGDGRQFAADIANAMKRRAAPLKPPEGRVGELLAHRAEHEMFGYAFYPDDMGWSVLYSKEGGLAEPAYSRTLFVREVGSIDEVKEFCSSAVQTVGLAVEGCASFAYSLMERGVDRCPPLGEMTLYEAPWDGLFPMNRLVRWCRHRATI